MHFLFNELQYAINKWTCHLYIITIFIANLSCNANHPNDIVLTLQWRCSILALFIMGNVFINYKYSWRAIRPIACKNVLKRVIFQLHIYHTRYIATY
jgi:hypothetical protein